MMTQEQSYIERKLPKTKLLAVDPWELEWLLNHVANDLLCLDTGEIAERLSTLWDKLIKSKDR